MPDVQVRRAAQRFCTRTDWLMSWHSFSYGQWYDPGNIAFGPLVVLNQDVLAPGAGFDDHRHSGVDLVTYVLSGALTHRDSTGHSAVVRAGEVQVLHAGSGVTHSERNASEDEPVEYVQMWVRSSRPEVFYEPPQAAARWGGLVDSGVDLTIRSLPERASTAAPASTDRYVYLIDGAARLADGVQLVAGDALCGPGDVGVLATAPTLLVICRVDREPPA